MPRYYCDYCDAFLTHDSPSVRKQHNSGRKHRDNVSPAPSALGAQSQGPPDSVRIPRFAAPPMPTTYNHW